MKTYNKLKINNWIYKISDRTVKEKIYMGNEIYIGVSDYGSLMRSMDSGLTWFDYGTQQPFGIVSEIYDIGTTGATNGIIYFKNNKEHVLMSNDYGDNWFDIGLMTRMDIIKYETKRRNQNNSIEIDTKRYDDTINSHTLRVPTSARKFR